MKEMLMARKEELQKRGKKGFTLMEMLIVIAIIAVLVAIAIPIFMAQLENSREATDAANIRSAYAEVTAAALADPDSPATATVDITQSDPDEWTNESIKDIAGVAVGSITITDKKVTVAYDNDSQVVTIGGQEAKTSFTS